MFNNEYENYMRSVLGYPITNDISTYNLYNNSSNQSFDYNDSSMYGSSNSYFPYRSNNVVYNDTSKYEELYPEIYKILKPMISKVCDTPSRNDFSSETLEIMANEIYTNIEQDIDVVNINVNTSSTKEAEYNKNENLSRNSNMKVTKSDTKNEETRQGCCGNPMLKDLIKIMIIQQLLQGNKPPRPPRPPHPPMPGPGPMPPHPPRPPYRGLENPDIYGNNYSSSQSYPYYNN
jgi:hypothetical protein